MAYLPERLTRRHDVSAFDSGRPPLDDWLRISALTAQTKGISATDVWAQGTRVLAYYSISPTSVVSDALPRSASTGLTVVPGYLLGKLALDVSLQGQGLGERLLVQALMRIADAAERGGGRLIVVDALDDAAAGFYAHFGFHAVVGTSRMWMKVATVSALPQWPNNLNALDSTRTDVL